MKATPAKIEDYNTEVSNLICCLEFLASEARNTRLFDVHAVIKRSIAEISAMKNSSGNDVAYKFEDILCAFKFFARFCCIEDPAARRNIISMVESLNKEVLKSYAI